MTFCLTWIGCHCTWLYKQMPPPCLFDFTSNF